MGYKYFNPNPIASHVGDCTVRALCKVLKKSWNDVYMQLCLTGEKMCDMPNSDEVWGSFLQKNGFQRKFVPNSCPICYRIRDFVKDYPEGEFIVKTDKHVVAVVDGDWYDTWDSGDETVSAFFERR